MKTPVLQLIHRYHGYVYESVGMISAFFTDTQQAHACAEQLRGLVGEVLIFGSHVTFFA